MREKEVADKQRGHILPRKRNRLNHKIKKKSSEQQRGGRKRGRSREKIPLWGIKQCIALAKFSQGRRKGKIIKGFRKKGEKQRYRSTKGTKFR